MLYKEYAKVEKIPVLWPKGILTNHRSHTELKKIYIQSIKAYMWYQDSSEERATICLWSITSEGFLSDMTSDIKFKGWIGMGQRYWEANRKDIQGRGWRMHKQYLPAELIVIFYYIIQATFWITIMCKEQVMLRLQTCSCIQSSLSNVIILYPNDR